MKNDQSFSQLPVILLLVLAFQAGCTPAVSNEQWIGSYTYPEHEEEFALYLDIVIAGGEVSGIAIDGNMDRASVSGSLKDGFYNLLLHPLERGNDQSQDVHYRGQRASNKISGEWEHMVGVRGEWNAKTTSLGPEEAIRTIEPQCGSAGSVVVNVSNDGCDGGA